MGQTIGDRERKKREGGGGEGERRKQEGANERAAAADTRGSLEGTYSALSSLDHELTSFRSFAGPW